MSYNFLIKFHVLLYFLLKILFLHSSLLLLNVQNVIVLLFLPFFLKLFIKFTCSATNLPNFGLNDEASSKISLIDVIWLKQNTPMCAFEVETSTSVYSGLLRMSDLIAVVPAINIKLYIVAQEERKNKVG